MNNTKSFFSFDTIKMLVTTSLVPTINKYPIFEKLVKTSKNENIPTSWDLYMLSCCCGIILIISEKSTGEHALFKKKLMELGGDEYLNATNNFINFMMEGLKSSKKIPDLFESLAGQWVLQNIKKSKLSNTELEHLAVKIGKIAITIANQSIIQKEENKSEKPTDITSKFHHKETTEINTDELVISSNNIKKIFLIITTLVVIIYIFNILREPSEYECMKLGSDNARDICMEEYHPIDGKKYSWSKNL